MSVIIVGAGVVGLTTALRLLQLRPTIKLTVLAEGFNYETTSAGAAGIFRPANSFMGPDIKTTREWIIDSYKFYYSLLKENCGIREISGYILSNKNSSLVQNHFLEEILEEYRPCSRAELCVHGNQYKYGTFFTTLLIECSLFLPWAQARMEKVGVIFKQEKVDSLEDLKGRADVIVNCTGIGACLLASDPELVPIRGLVLKMDAPWLDKFYYLDFDTYIIPTRPLITVGGSRHYDSWNLNFCRHDAAAIQERAEAFLSPLKSAKIVKTWTGLRPHRKSVRVKVEHFNGLTVVHNYGHGGYGVTSAPGTALKAAKLVLQMLPKKGKL